MQSALLILGVIIASVGAVAIWAAVVSLRRSLSPIERNCGGPCRYQHGDRVVFTYGGSLVNGTFKGIGPRIDGQPEILRIVTVRAQWVDAAGQVFFRDINMPYWRIRGKVRHQPAPRKVNKKSWNTAKHFAMERWVR